MKTVLIMTSLILAASCSSQNTWDRNKDGQILTKEGQNQREAYVENQCSQDSMVGMDRSFSGALELKKEKLERISGTLTLSRRSALSQELEGYSVKWQFAKNDRDQTCRSYAACRFVNQEHAYSCSQQRDDFNLSREQMNKLIVEMSSLEISTE